MYRENKEHPVTEQKHPCLTEWRRRVDWAERQGSFHNGYREAAARWDMCAVGEAQKRYGIAIDNKSRKPKDLTLKRLGSDFSEAVNGDNFDDCRRLITAIEHRLAELA